MMTLVGLNSCNMNNGTMLFHQGWTDIINCLPLINFHEKKYEKINLIVREDSKPIIDFYISQFENVFPIYIDKFRLDNQLHLIVPNFKDTDILFFGLHDGYRNKSYVNQFLNSKPNTFFVEKFYTCYDIDYINRVESFEIKRDFNNENKMYDEFVSKHGTNYILYHEDFGRNIILNKSEFNKNYKSVNLDKISYVFFDFIKILENAKEIHLIDSVWSAIVYLLDSKYKLFKNIPIKVNCLREYKQMFTEPIKLDNWEII